METTRSGSGFDETRRGHFRVGITGNRLRTPDGLVTSLTTSSVTKTALRCTNIMVDGWTINVLGLLQAVIISFARLVSFRLVFEGKKPPS